MAVANVIQRGSTVYVYDEQGRLMWNHSGELHGYTDSTVSVQRGSMFITYDDKGYQVSAKSAD